MDLLDEEGCQTGRVAGTGGVRRVLEFEEYGKRSYTPLAPCSEKRGAADPNVPSGASTAAPVFGLRSWVQPWITEVGYAIVFASLLLWPVRRRRTKVEPHEPHLPTTREGTNSVCVLDIFWLEDTGGLAPQHKTVGSTSAMALPQGGTAGSMATDLMFGVAPIAFEWAQARQAETRPDSQVLGFS